MDHRLQLVYEMLVQDAITYAVDLPAVEVFNRFQDMPGTDIGSILDLAEDFHRLLLQAHGLYGVSREVDLAIRQAIRSVLLNGEAPSNAQIIFDMILYDQGWRNGRNVDCVSRTHPFIDESSITPLQAIFSNFMANIGWTFRGE